MNDILQANAQTTEYQVQLKKKGRTLFGEGEREILKEKRERFGERERERGVLTFPLQSICRVHPIILKIIAQNAEVGRDLPLWMCTEGGIPP